MLLLFALQWKAVGDVVVLRLHGGLDFPSVTFLRQIIRGIEADASKERKICGVHLHLCVSVCLCVCLSIIASVCHKGIALLMECMCCFPFSFQTWVLSLLVVCLCVCVFLFVGVRVCTCVSVYLFLFCHAGVSLSAVVVDWSCVMDVDYTVVLVCVMLQLLHVLVGQYRISP